MQQKMAKLISGELIIGDFEESAGPFNKVWTIRDPLRVMLYQHPQDESKLVIDLTPLNPFASKGDKLQISDIGILCWIPDTDKTKGVYSQYNAMITGIVTPEVSNLKLQA